MLFPIKTAIDVSPCLVSFIFSILTILSFPGFSRFPIMARLPVDENNPKKHQLAEAPFSTTAMPFGAHVWVNPLYYPIWRRQCNKRTATPFFYHCQAHPNAGLSAYGEQKSLNISLQRITRYGLPIKGSFQLTVIFELT